jgi:hypothetical protein
MRRRCVICAGITATTFLVALVVLAALPPLPGVTKANFDRIQEGMTLVQVEAILGEPAKDFMGEGDFTGHLWAHENGSRVWIVFRGGLVLETEWIEGTETTTQKIRRWLHLEQ